MVTRFTLLLILLPFIGFAQKPLTEYNTNELFGNRGEIYFYLEGAVAEVNTLTKIISIDNVKDGNVYAYASVKEFNELKARYNFNLVQLKTPSELFKADITNSSREVLDWNYYPTYNAYLQIMQDFATNFPNLCVIDTIGTSIEGRLILAARISDNVGVEEDEPEFLYTSSMHGDETTGYILTLHLIDYLLLNYGNDDRVTNMVDNIDIWINPLANPDGTYAGGNNTVNGATRYNASYVDLNRNYPDPADGPHPDGNQWQQETVAFMDFAESRDFVLSANFHGGAEVVNYPWDTWSRLTADDAWWRMVSRKYADTVHENAPSSYFTDLNNGITNGYAWYRITGGRQDYMNYYRQCREFTLEVSNTKLLPASQLINHWNYNYRSMLNYMEESLYGIRGMVTDTITGEPLKAQVFISGFDKDSSMVFSSMPVGNYHRLIKAGTYNITYFAEGYLPKTVKNIAVNDLASTVVNVNLWDGTPIPAFTSSDTLIAPAKTIQFFDNSGGSPTSRLWTFEGGTPGTSTEANPFITYANAGIYDVSLQVTNVIGSNTLTRSDLIEVRVGVGVGEISLNSLSLYPNPVTGNRLYIKSTAQPLNYRFTDLSGKVISSNNLDAGAGYFDVSFLNNGIYLLVITDRDGTSVYKVIVKK